MLVESAKPVLFLLQAIVYGRHSGQRRKGELTTLCRKPFMMTDATAQSYDFASNGTSCDFKPT